MDAYDAWSFGLFAATLGCFWRAWRTGELRDITVTVRRWLQQGVSGTR